MEGEEGGGGQATDWGGGDDCCDSTCLAIAIFSSLLWFGIVVGILLLENDWVLQSCAITIILIVIINEALKITTYSKRSS